MITKLNIDINIDQKLHTFNLGSILHGLLMEKLSNETASLLHQYHTYSPLKQRVYKENNSFIWEIISFNRELSTEILNIISSNNDLYLKHHDENIKINKYVVERLELDDLIDEIFSKKQLDRYINIKIQSPISFKSEGKYLTLPDINLFYRSIMLQFDTFFEKRKMFDREVLDFINKNIYITHYKLRTTRFHLEKTKIPSFIGEMTYKVEGPLTFLQLIYLLTTIGEYTGVGIKTSLGMGKYKLINR